MVLENGGEPLLDHGEQMVAEKVHFVGRYAVEPKMDHEEAGHDLEQKKAHLEVDQDVELHVQVQALDHELK